MSKAVMIYFEANFWISKRHSRPFHLLLFIGSRVAPCRGRSQDPFKSVARQERILWHALADGKSLFLTKKRKQGSLTLFVNCCPYNWCDSPCQVDSVRRSIQYFKIRRASGQKSVSDFFSRLAFDPFYKSLLNAL